MHYPKFRRFLASPIFKNEDKTRVAGLLNIILLVMLAVTIVYSLFSPLMYDNPLPVLAIIGVEMVLLLGLRSLMHYGQVQLASFVFTSTLWLIYTFAALFSGGVDTFAFSSHMLVILVAGLLLGGWASVSFAALSILAGLGLLYLENAVLLPLPFFTVTPIAVWAGGAANFIIASVLLYLATYGINDTLDHARQSEANARKAQAQLIDAIESLTEAFALYDADDRLVLCNSKYRKFYDLSEDLLVPGIRFRDHIRISAHRGQIAEAIGREEMWVQERVAQHQNPQGVYLQQLGNGRWLQVNERKTREGGIVGVRTDITERVQAEEALERSEKYFRSLIENVLDVITILNSDGIIRYESPSVERILAYKPEDLVGHNVFEFIHPDDLPKMKKALANRSQTAEPGPLIEFRFRHKDDSWRILEAIGTNMLDDPIMAGVVINSRDITERKQLEEQFRQSHKMEALGQLTAGIAHDFNNLLTAINGFAGLLQYKLPSDSPHQKSLDKILYSGQLAADLVQRLLVFSRKQIIEPQVLDLNTRVTQMGTMLERIISEKVILVTNLEKDLWAIKADPTQIEQIIVNLAVNAQDAMPEGGRLAIETANVLLNKSYVSHHFDARPGQYVLLTVSDTGFGMSEEVQDHIFEPFFTTKEQGKGTGLGLASVYGIVKQNEGYIWVYSELGIGTTFKIYLPRIRERISLPINLDVEGEMPVGNETILLVEDNDEVRSLVRQVLLNQGYTLLEAEGSQQALQLTAQYTDPIHLLLTDVIMPGMSGKLLAGQLAQLQPDLKILFMSGYTDEAIVHHGVLDPEISFLQKPFSPTDLAYKVRNVLDS